LSGVRQNASASTTSRNSQARLSSPGASNATSSLNTPRLTNQKKAFFERFNGIYRDDVPDAWCFMNLSQVREEPERWLKEYNTARPHESLGDVSPIEFPTDRDHAEISSYTWT